VYITTEKWHEIDPLRRKRAFSGSKFMEMWNEYKNYRSHEEEKVT
jgi:hypothetical protein